MPCGCASYFLQIPSLLKILIILILLVQSLFYTIFCERWYFFVFYIVLVSFFAIFGEFALARMNMKMLWTYGIYLSIYLCFATGMLMGLILGMTVHWEPSSPPSSTNSTTTEPVQVSINGTTLTEFIMGTVLDIIAILLSLLMIRFLYILLKQLKRQNRRSEPSVTYMIRLPGAPPRYTPTSTDTVPNTPLSSPISPPPAFDTIFLQEKEALGDRRESLPPAYSTSEQEAGGSRNIDTETPIL